MLYYKCNKHISYTVNRYTVYVYIVDKDHLKIQFVPPPPLFPPLILLFFSFFYFQLLFPAFYNALKIPLIIQIAAVVCKE